MSEANRYMDQILEIRHVSPEEERKLCLKLLEIADTEYVSAFAHTYLSDAFQSMGMLDEAIAEYHLAIELIEKNRYERLSLVLYNLAGIIYIRLDDEQGALDCFFKEMEVAERMNDQMMCAVAVANIAYVYRSAKAFDKAEKTLEKAHAIAENARKKEAASEQSAVFGNAFYNMLCAGLAVDSQKTEKAFYHLEQLEKEQIPSLDIPLLYASCYAQQGKKEAALLQINNIWDAVENIRNRFEKLEHYFDILEVFLKLGEYEKGQKLALKCEELLSQMKSDGKWRKLLEYEIQIYEALGEEEKLNQAYERFFEWDTNFKQISQNAAIKRLKKRLELQVEAERRSDMENWQNVLAKRSEYDELTGVLNRRGIRKYMKDSFTQAKLQKETFAVLIADIDFFKEFNDSYGHIAGDGCLKQVAKMLQKTVNVPEVHGMVGRYGGDEFLITLFGCKTELVLEIAGKIKKALENLAISNEKSAVFRFVTLSIGGVNIIPSGPQAFSYYIEEADKVLYELKKCSKNNFRVTESVAGDENG